MLARVLLSSRCGPAPFMVLQDFASCCSGSDCSSTSDRTSSTGMMREVSESVLMDGWCSPETTKNIQDVWESQCC